MTQAFRWGRRLWRWPVWRASEESMCLAVPAKIIELLSENHAVVEIAGAKRQANVAFIEDPRLGDYVLLHAGFAIQKWTAEDVREYEDLIKGNAAPFGPTTETA